LLDELTSKPVTASQMAQMFEMVWGRPSVLRIGMARRMHAGATFGKKTSSDTHSKIYIKASIGDGFGSGEMRILFTSIHVTGMNAAS
jgi:hypothetical protein